MIHIISALALLTVCHAVDRSKFRTCADTGFCKRYRGLEGPRDGHNVSSAGITSVDHNLIFGIPTPSDCVFFHFQYALDLSTLKSADGILTGKVYSPAAEKQLNLRVFVLSSGSVRLKITEDSDRWQVHCAM